MNFSIYGQLLTDCFWVAIWIFSPIILKFLAISIFSITKILDVFSHNNRVMSNNNSKQSIEKKRSPVLYFVFTSIVLFTILMSVSFSSSLEKWLKANIKTTRHEGNLRTPYRPFITLLRISQAKLNKLCFEKLPDSKIIILFVFISNSIRNSFNIQNRILLMKYWIRLEMCCSICFILYRWFV